LSHLSIRSNFWTSIGHFDVAAAERLCEVGVGPDFRLGRKRHHQPPVGGTGIPAAGEGDQMAVRSKLSRQGSSGALQRIGVLAGAILAGVALMCVTASGAAAKEQRAFFLAGEASGEEAKKPRFEGEIYPTYLFGTSKPKFEYLGGQVLECPGDFSGQLKSAGPEVALTSFYYLGACKTGGWALSITANGCENTLTVLNQGPPYAGNWGYKCPTGFYYEFHLSAFGIKCSIAIPSQTGLATVGLENTGTGKQRSIVAALKVSKLKYTMKGNSPEICRPGEYEDGTITDTLTLKGFNEA
jgi:hypothetical protein